MTQSLLLIGLFLFVLACLPFAVTRLKQRYGMGMSNVPGQSRIVSAVAVGPNQRVVTVEVGPDTAKTWLVLGVTPQAVTCLHTLPAEGVQSSTATNGAAFSAALLGADPKSGGQS